MSWLILLLAGLYARTTFSLPSPAPAPHAAAPVLAPLTAPPGMLPIFFLSGDALKPVLRAQGEGTPESALRLLFAGPTAAERAKSVATALPRGARVLRVYRRGMETIVDVSELTPPEARPRAVAQIAATLSNFPGITAVRVCVRGRPVRAVLAAQFLNPTPFARREPGAGAAAAQAGIVPAVPYGPLAGKVIVISPGHGLTRFGNGRWRYQRPFYDGEVEDRLNMRFAARVCGELRRLGATVLTTRPPVGTDEPGVSGAPRWEEAAKYYLRDIGMPDWVHQPLPADFDSDIDARPLYANYHAADLLISLHNNIGPNSGTLTLYDTTNGFAPESRRLASLLQRHVVRAVRAEIEPRWRSHGTRGSDAQYGENHWAHMPSALIEIGFISRRSDRRLLTDPRFHDAVGRAVAAAVAEYFGVPAGPWPLPGPATDTALPVSAPRPSGVPTLVCAGDPAGAPEMAHAGGIAALLGRAAGSTVRVMKAGRADDTLNECLRQWETEVAQVRPTHVLLAFGRADLVRDESGHSRVPVGRFEAALTEAVRRTRALGAVPVLATMAPIDDRCFHAHHPAERYAAVGGVQAVRDCYNAAIRRVARRTGAALADISLAAWKQEVRWVVPDTPGDALVPADPERLARMILNHTPAFPRGAAR